MIPPVPDSLIDCDMLDTELAELWHALVVELLEEEYAGRRHGNRRTYDAGCKGPLCRKGVREHGRRRNATQPNEKYRIIDALLEAWTPVAIERISEVKRTIVEELTA